jgi:hypothetical protein
VEAHARPDIDDILDRWEDLRARGDAVCAEDLCRDAPHLRDELRRRIEALNEVDELLQPEGERDRRGNREAARKRKKPAAGGSGF